MWPDWQSLQLHNTHLVWCMAITVVVGITGAVLPWRHSRTTTAVAGMLRVLVIGLVGFAIVGFVRVEASENRFEPHGTWRLALDHTKLPPADDVLDWRTTPDRFVTELRDAMAAGAPPVRAEVHGRDAAPAILARDRVQALGLPCEVFYPDREKPVAEPLLTGIDAPLAVKPGEPFIVSPDVAGPVGEVRILLDGKPLDVNDGEAEVRTDIPGPHTIETILLDDSGKELQRIGHVFRVGNRPSVLAIGLDPEQLTRAQTLAPGYDFRGVSTAEFSKVGDDTGIVLSTVDALYQLGSDRVFEISAFVARGGGLYVTGDGAKYVAPEYMTDEVRRLLPVTLRKEGKKPPEEDPPVEREDGEAEIAKVSLLFVLDRSLSMNATIGERGRMTRWQVAIKGVVESMRLVEEGGSRDEKSESEAINTRVGVMAFTLSQEWVYDRDRMQPAIAHPFNRQQVEKELDRMTGDKEFSDTGYNTDIYAAMENAIEVMKAEPSAVKVIVMITDGADRPENVRDGKKHSDLRDLAIQNDINIYAVGIGDVFSRRSTDALSARKVIQDLATKPDFQRIPADTKAAEEAHVIFVEATETAFKAFDDKKKKEEEERQKRLKEKEEESEQVEVMPGSFELMASAFGNQLFGDLPQPPPKLGWLARCESRDGSAVALSANTDEHGVVPTLAFKSYGLGRVGFWGAGTDPEDLGELSAWAEFPGIFAASLRWLTPRVEPDIRLVGDASPEGVNIRDPLPDAAYVLRTKDGDIPLTHNDGVLTGDSALPLGPGEIIERISNSDESIERRIGDVYVAAKSAPTGHQFAADHAFEPPALGARKLEVVSTKTEAILPVLYLLTLMLMLMPVERLIRRRT